VTSRIRHLNFRLRTPNSSSLRAFVIKLRSGLVWEYRHANIGATNSVALQRNGQRPSDKKEDVYRQTLSLLFRHYVADFLRSPSAKLAANRAIVGTIFASW
jgi:hypothetical protein